MNPAMSSEFCKSGRYHAHRNDGPLYCPIQVTEYDKVRVIMMDKLLCLIRLIDIGRALDLKRELLVLVALWSRGRM